MAGISNHYIDSVLGRTSTTYRGTYSSDILPRRDFKELPASLVVNLSRHTEKTGHFVAIYEDEQNMYYMDSLGLKPFVPTLTHFIERSGKQLHYNTTAIQSAKSEYCGFFAMCYILWCEKVGPTLDQFIAMFDTILNHDALVVHLINKLIRF